MCVVSILLKEKTNKRIIFILVQTITTLLLNNKILVLMFQISRTARIIYTVHMRCFLRAPNDII